MGFLFTWLADAVIWPCARSGLDHLKWLGELLSSMGFRFWGFILIAAGVAYEGFSLIGDLTIEAAQKAASLFDGTLAGTAAVAGQTSPDSATANYLAIANTFYPLDETVRMAAALITLWIAIMVFRLIKMAIPFFSAP